MADWISKLFEQLVHALDDIFDIVDLNIVMQTITVFEQVQLTKEQLQQTNVFECMESLYDDTPNQYLQYRLSFILTKWRDILREEPSKKRKTHRAVSSSVFEAIIMDDDRFFKTKSVPELLHRLLKSFDRNYKVTDMATVLNTISVFENMNIPASQLAQTHLVTYLRKLRRRSTNKYLSNRLRILLRKWRDTLDITSKHKIVREC